jgi:excisionase family DNA binding protein
VNHLSGVPLAKRLNSIANSPKETRRSNTSVSRKRGNNHRLAELRLIGFITEIVTNLRNEGFADITAAELLSQLLSYSKNGGRRLLVRMPTGRLQVHRAFDWNNPSKSYPVIEIEQASDETLPVYSSLDFSHLDGLTRDLRDKSDELGLPWKIAVSVCESMKARKAAGTSDGTKQIARELASLNKRVMTIDETARLLRCSRSTVYRWLEGGPLKCADMGRPAGTKGEALVLTSSIRPLFEESSQ